VSACDYVLSCHALNGVVQGPSCSGAYLVLKSPGYDRWGPGRVTRRIYNGWVGGKIMRVRGYCDGREDRYRLFSGLILFSLVVPPLQSGMMRLYLVWGT
jgi:hypothetical protein